MPPLQNKKMNNAILTLETCGKVPLYPNKNNMMQLNIRICWVKIERWLFWGLTIGILKIRICALLMPIRNRWSNLRLRFFIALRRAWRIKKIKCTSIFKSKFAISHWRPGLTGYKIFMKAKKIRKMWELARSCLHQVRWMSAIYGGRSSWKNL